MNRPKLKLDRIWPDLQVVSNDEEAPETDSREAGRRGTKTGPRRIVPREPASHNRRPNGSYCLRRGAIEMVSSVYLTRVLEYLEKLLWEEGDGPSRELALVWIAGDGSREIALKGRALTKLGLFRR